MEVITIKSKFLKNLFDQNTYVLKNESGAIIIDAGAELDDVKLAVGNQKVYAILMTHLHFDHFWNIDKYLKEFDCCVYVCESAEVKFVDYSKNCSTVIKKEVVKNIDEKYIKFYKNELKFADFLVNVYLTPGHSADCVCLKIDNTLFSGDTLFANGIGRTDLFDSDNNHMIASLNKIKAINFDVVYPGHYESATKSQAIKVIEHYV